MLNNKMDKPKLYRWPAALNSQLHVGELGCPSRGRYNYTWVSLGVRAEGATTTRG